MHACLSSYCTHHANAPWGLSEVWAPELRWPMLCRDVCYIYNSPAIYASGDSALRALYLGVFHHRTKP